MDREAAFAKFAVQAAQCSAAVVIGEIAALVFRFGWKLSHLTVESTAVILGGLIVAVVVSGIPLLLSFNCVYPKRSSIHWLLTVPWLSTIGTTIWACYWYLDRETHSFEPMTKTNEWIGTALVFALLLSLCSWTTLLFMRRNQWIRITIAAVPQLALQLIAFVTALVFSVDIMR